MCVQGRVLMIAAEIRRMFVCSSTLEKEGFQCRVASTLNEAVDLLQGMRFDVLIVASDLKKITVESIRQMSALAHGVPVILIRGDCDEAAEWETLPVSVVACLTEPLDFQELVLNVQLTVRRKRMLLSVQRTLDRVISVQAQLREAEVRIHSAFPELVCAESETDLRAVSLSWRAFEDGRGAKKGTGECPAGRTVLECPRTNLFIHVLKDAIVILERTKSAFRSRELGALRMRLEQLLAVTKWETGMHPESVPRVRPGNPVALR